MFFKFKVIVFKLSIISLVLLGVFVIFSFKTKVIGPRVLGFEEGLQLRTEILDLCANKPSTIAVYSDSWWVDLSKEGYENAKDISKGGVISCGIHGDYPYAVFKTKRGPAGNFVGYIHADKEIFDYCRNKENNCWTVFEETDSRIVTVEERAVENWFSVSTGW